MRKQQQADAKNSGDACRSYSGFRRALNSEPDARMHLQLLLDSIRDHEAMLIITPRFPATMRAGRGRARLGGIASERRGANGIEQSALAAATAFRAEGQARNSFLPERRSVACRHVRSQTSSAEVRG